MELRLMQRSSSLFKLRAGGGGGEKAGEGKDSPPEGNHWAQL